MAPKKKKRPPAIQCDHIEGERFTAHQDDVFSYNWWEVFCFPYSMCARFWDCCISLCAGTNQCMVYWMMIQWLICKITRITTPDPIIFPYYFYLFCQVIILTTIFGLFWHWWGMTVLVPYFMAFYYALVDLQDPEGTAKRNNTKHFSLRKYCFRKSELFDSPPENNGVSKSIGASYPLNFISVALELYFFENVF